MQMPRPMPSRGLDGTRGSQSANSETGLVAQGCNALEWIKCGAAIAACSALSGPALIACVASAAPGCVKCVS